MEVDDILADEMMYLRARITPPGIERFAMTITPLLRGCKVTNGSIKPDKPVVARTVWNLESEVRSWTRNIPVPQRFMQEMSLQIIGNLFLLVFSTLGPFGKEVVQGLDFNEQVIVAF